MENSLSKVTASDKLLRPLQLGGRRRWQRTMPPAPPGIWRRWIGPGWSRATA